MLPNGNNSGKRISLRATNIELHGRDTSVTADDRKIHLRDSDNLYPLRMEKVINNSPTGRRCANLMAKFITGDGVADNAVINDRGQTINDLADMAAGEISMHYGVFFHLKWTLEVNGAGDSVNLKKTNVKVLDTLPMAVAKRDDDDFPGKFYQLNLQEGKSLFSKADAKSSKWFYPYSEDSKVIKAQMLNDCKLKEISEPDTKQLIENYRGQIFYLNLTPKYFYALPPWDAVYDDMDTEYRISRYNNNQSRNGWLGKTIIKKFSDDQEEDDRDGNSFNDVLKENLGSENSSDVMVVDVPMSSAEDIDKVFKIDQVKAQFDDKLFDSTKKGIRQNIAGAFNNIPEPLIFAGTGALFGTSADTYGEMKKFYWEQNERERFKLEKILTKLLEREVSFIPLIDEEATNEDEELRKKSQAELKGSVGGVTALLEIQKSVSAGTTDIGAAVEIIKEIFGIEEQTARKMLGTPEKIQEDGLQ